jgi:hypothetical protein
MQNAKTRVHGPNNATVELTITSISLAKGLASWIVYVDVRATLERPFPQYVRVGGFLGTLSVHIPPLFDRLGRLQPQSASHVDVTRTGSDVVRLICELSPQQLATLEERRVVGPMLFDISFNVSLTHIDDRDARNTNEEVTLRHTIEQSQWADMLTSVGYDTVVVIELPDMVDKDPRLASAASHFRRSREALSRKDYESVVLNGRKVVEALEGQLGDSDVVLASFARAASSGTETWKKFERVRLLRAALRAVSHPAAHGSPNAVDHAWTEDDAIGSLLVQAGLLRLMRGHPETLESIDDARARLVKWTQEAVRREGLKATTDTKERSRVVGQLAGKAIRLFGEVTPDEVRKVIAETLTSNHGQDSSPPGDGG